MRNCVNFAQLADSFPKAPLSEANLMLSAPPENTIFCHDITKPDRMNRAVLETNSFNARDRAGFVLANGGKSGHSCSVKIAEDIRQHAAEQGVCEEEALKRGTEAKSKEFVEQGLEV